MNKAYKILLVAVLVVFAASSTFAQRTRTVNEPMKPESKEATTTSPPAPQTVRARYEGGVFGYNRKQDGTLNFDDGGPRLSFRDKVQHEIFTIPYKAVVAAFADTQSRRPTAATIAGSVFPYGLPALFIRKKYRYLTIQYKDPDTQVAGVTSFKLQNKEILASVLNTLASKAGLTQRGEIFVRRNEATTTNPSSGQATSPN